MIYCMGQSPKVAKKTVFEKLNFGFGFSFQQEKSNLFFQEISTVLFASTIWRGGPVNRHTKFEQHLLCGNTLTCREETEERYHMKVLYDNNQVIHPSRSSGASMQSSFVFYCLLLLLYRCLLRHLSYIFIKILCYIVVSFIIFRISS